MQGFELSWAFVREEVRVMVEVVKRRKWKRLFSCKYVTHLVRCVQETVLSEHKSARSQRQEVRD